MKAGDTVITSYINPNPKKVSEVDLKKALREVNEKNKRIRESFRITPEVLNFYLLLKWK